MFVLDYSGTPDVQRPPHFPLNLLCHLIFHHSPSSDSLQSDCTSTNLVKPFLFYVPLHLPLPHAKSSPSSKPGNNITLFTQSFIICVYTKPHNPPSPTTKTNANAVGESILSPRPSAFCLSILEHTSLSWLCFNYILLIYTLSGQYHYY